MHQAIVSAQERIHVGEARIIWLEPPERFPYVREYVASHRDWMYLPERLHSIHETLVAYSELSLKHRRDYHGYLRRRYWVVTIEDRYNHDLVSGPGNYVWDAVDPQSVVAGQPSKPVEMRT